MIDMNKETTRTLAKRLNDWQKHKPKWESTKTEMFRCCQELATRLLSKRRRLGLSEEDAIEFTTYLAEELYLLVMTRDDIGDHFNYANVSLKGYLVEWYEQEGRRTPPYNEADHAYYNPAAALRYTPFDMEAITNKDQTVILVRNLVSDLNKCLRYTKVFSSSVAKLNARVSLDLSIKYGRFVSFRLSESDESLCRYLYNKFRVAFQRIVNDSHVSTLSAEQYLQYTACEIRSDQDESEKS